MKPSNYNFYAEARRLLPSDPEKADRYQRCSIQALCQEARKFHWGERHDTDQYDLWKHFKGLRNGDEITYPFGVQALACFFHRGKLKFALPLLRNGEVISSLILISAVNDGDAEYGVMGYNGGLFDDDRERFLGQHQLRNDFMQRALYLLAFVEPFNNEPEEEYAIPYEDLEVRHLGELYENILEYTVQLADADRIRRRTKKGVEMPLASQTTQKQGDTLIKKGDVYFGESALERKQTGSYYTPESLVRFLNEKTIIQPLKEKFDQAYRKRFDELLDQAQKGYDAGARRGAAQAASVLVERFVEKEVLEFRVCDPAMGSGHFLVDAANQMAGLVASLFAETPMQAIMNAQSGRMHQNGNRHSGHSSLNYWRRRITRHCIYGVDLNPLAVNLAKLSLWLNCFASEHKLTFLDHHIRCGNSLIGVRSLDQLASIPERKKGRKKKHAHADELFPDFKEYAAVMAEAGRDVQSIGAMDEDETDEQKAVFDRARAKLAVIKPMADLYTAYLMDSNIRLENYNAIFYSMAKQQPLNNALNPDLLNIAASVQDYRARHHFFHWPLEFPDLFLDEKASFQSGFSATVGNPPWDIVKPNSQEFFSDYDPKFRSYKKQEANAISKKLLAANPAIAARWEQHRRGFAEQSAYFKEPLSYSALGKGDINTFKLFLEQFFTILSEGGRMGIVVPSGLYTDQGCQQLRERFFYESRVAFLYGFENRWPTVFSAVDGRFKLIIFGTQKGGKTDQFKCAFMEHDPERLPLIDANALKMSVKQVKRFSPDTFSVMEFKSQKDIDVTEKIYCDWPLLIEKIKNTWNVKLTREFDTSTDSVYFKDSVNDFPLYEGKIICSYDNRFSPVNYWLEEADVRQREIHKKWKTLLKPKLNNF